MSIDWDYYGKKAYQAIRENGMTATISFGTASEGYDFDTGKDVEPSADADTGPYSTHAIMKNFSSEMKNIVNPEDVEITFHSGSVPDTIPDLLDKIDIQITTDNKIYEVISIEAVRPAGVTMIYKARAKEYGGS